MKEKDLINEMSDYINKAFDETLGNYGPLEEAIKEHYSNGDVYICDLEYHKLPIIPKSGSMTFECNSADDVLATIKSILSNTTCNITVSWEVIDCD